MRYLTINLLCGLCVIFLIGCIGLPSTSKLSKSTVPSIGASASGSPARKAIQTFVNWQTTICIVGGLACLAFGGLAIYGGQLLPGIKLVLAGILLPIFGIWFAYHWLLVVILALIGAAAYVFIVHYTLIRPALVAVESWAATVEARLGVHTPALPAASAPIVNVPSGLVVASAVPNTITPASILAAIHKT